jgi:hypothetical protein
MTNIDWNKPVETIFGRMPVEVVRVEYNKNALIKFAGRPMPYHNPPDDGQVYAFVDEKGGLIATLHTGVPPCAKLFVRNVEENDWNVLYKKESGDWYTYRESMPESVARRLASLYTESVVVKVK